jgi:hypothetical protein
VFFVYVRTARNEKERFQDGCSRSPSLKTRIANSLKPIAKMGPEPQALVWLPRILHSHHVIGSKPSDRAKRRQAQEMAVENLAEVKVRPAAFRLAWGASPTAQLVLASRTVSKTDGTAPFAETSQLSVGERERTCKNGICWVLAMAMEPPVPREVAFY